MFQPSLTFLDVSRSFAGRMRDEMGARKGGLRDLEAGRSGRVATAAAVIGIAAQPIGRTGHPQRRERVALALDLETGNDQSTSAERRRLPPVRPLGSTNALSPSGRSCWPSMRPVSRRQGP